MPPVPTALKRLALAAALAGAALALLGCASREERIQEYQAEASQALFDNRSSEAIELLGEGLRKFPDSNELRIALSGAVQNAGDLERAAALLEEAVAMDPEMDQLWVRIGELRAQLGQSEDAIRAFENYLKNHADDFLAWKALALEQEKLGRLTEAIKAASKWNELTPSSQPALKLGELYLESRNLPQARSWFGQAAAYGDAYAAKEALAELVKLETSIKQFQQALVWLEQYQSRYGNDGGDAEFREARTVLDNWIRAREEIKRAAAELERERRQLEEGRLGGDAPPAADPTQDATIATSDRQRPNAGNRRPVTPPAAQESAASATNAPSADAGANPTSATPTEKPPLALFGDASRSSEPAPAEDARPDESPPEPAFADPAGQLSPLDEAMAAIEAGDPQSAIPLLLDLLGENADDPQLWYQLSRAYFAQRNWYDAETMILEAKRRAPRSEVIANQYLRTIQKTQNLASVLEEAKALRALFPRSPAIALTLAQALREGAAHRSLIASAYRDFLSLADRGTPGFEEARQYLQSGN